MKQKFMKYRIVLLLALVIAALIYYNPGPIVPVEKVDIPSGVSIDLNSDAPDDQKNMLAMSTYTFNQKDKIHSFVVSGVGSTIPETRASRQSKSNHKILVALQKTLICSDEKCRSGINDILDILFTNEYMNDMSWAVVCQGKAIDMLGQQVDDYPSSSDYIDGMIENCKEYYFFSNNYKIMDMYVRIGAEGRDLVLPYLISRDDKLEIAGLALFKGDKMVKEINLDEAKTMNMLRENKVKGLLEYQTDLNNYASIYGKASRKVSCTKSDGKYHFTINVNFKGSIISNTMQDLDNDPSNIHQLEKQIAQQAQQQCQDFVYKMQNEYRVDCLELGRVACAKYGRDTGVDWNETISNSDIKVNVTVTITASGRGNYAATNES